MANFRVWEPGFFGEASELARLPACPHGECAVDVYDPGAGCESGAHDDGGPRKQGTVEVQDDDAAPGAGVHSGKHADGLGFGQVVEEEGRHGDVDAQTEQVRRWTIGEEIGAQPASSG